MPILNPSPESSTTRPDSDQSMPNQEGASLVESRKLLAYSFRFTDHALGTPNPEIDIISDGNLVLQVADIDGDNNYVRVGDKGGFHAEASRKDAQQFQFNETELGVELFLGQSRPAIFDDYYDVSIGEWKSGRSCVPVLVHRSVGSIWPSASVPAATQNASGDRGE